MTPAASSPAVLVGIVGFTPVLDSYPLGPKLMAAMEAELRGHEGVVVENMSWSPIHVVQRFQDEGASLPDRLILVGASAICRRPGRIQAFRWMGGTLPDLVMQERIYEAVTGVVDLENTLIIGTHFGIWPEEAFSVEIDLAADTFGRMVIADSEGWANDRTLTDHLGFSPAAATAELAANIVALATHGRAAQIAIEPKSTVGFAKVEPFIRNRSVGAG